MPGALEREEDLLEVRLGEPGALGDVAHRGGARLVGVERERQQRPARVVAPRRDPHDGRLYGRPTIRLDAPATAPCPTTPHLPAYDARLHHERGAGAARTRTRATPSWLPAPVARRRAGGAARDRRARLEPAAARARTSRPRWRRSTATPITTVAPEHHRHRAHLDHHRAAAGRARRDGLPHRGGRRGPQRAAVDHRRPRRPQRRSSPASCSRTRRSAASARRCSPGPSSRAPGSRSRTSTRCASPATAPSARSPPSSCGCAAPASRSCTRTTRASTRSSHEYGLGAQYDEELRWIDHLVATLLEVAPGRHRARHHRRPRPGRDRRRRARAARATCITHVAMQSGEGRFRWLHARSGRAPALVDAAASLLGDHAWVRTPRAGHRRGLVRPEGHRRGGGPPRRRAARRHGARWRSSTRRTPAPTCSSAATARSPPTRCSCRSSPAWPEA